jgi:hypothetical protein
MATTWETVRKRACRRYGLAPEVEDALLSVPLFLDRVNELLQGLAQVGGGFRETFTVDLPTTAAVALSARVLRVLDGTVRVDYDGDGVFETEPELAQEGELRRCFGALESAPAGVPDYYYTQRGSAVTESASMLALVLHPRSAVARTGGLQMTCRVSPAAVTAGTENLPLQAAEERFLIPGICLALAETELSRGRRDAPVALWEARWEKALTDYADAVEDSTRGDQRRVLHTGDHY